MVHLAVEAGGKVSRDPVELTRQAWEYLDEFMRTGKITVPEGGGPDGKQSRVVIPDKEDPTARVLVDVCKWLGQLQGKPKKTPRAMDDWKPAETKG